MKVVSKAKKLARKILPRPILYRLLRELPRLPASLPQGLQFKIAETTSELEGAFSLLHDAYVEVGLMKPNESGMRVTPYHALPSSTTLIGKIGEKVVATVTIVRDNPLGLPCEAFTDLTHLRKGGDQIAEISALAVDRSLRGSLLFHLLKYMYELCVGYLGVDHLIATLTADSGAHQLYEALLFFRPLEAKIETNYSFANFRPVIAEHLSLRDAYQHFENAYSGKAKDKDFFRFFVKDRFEGNQYPDRRYKGIDFPIMDDKKFKTFFVDRTSALKDMNLKQLTTLRWIFQNQSQRDLIDQVLRESHGVFALDSRRRDGRFSVCEQGWLHCGSGEPSPLRILDVSRRGLRIASLESLALPAKISLTGEDGTHYELSVTKAWSNSEGITGLRIIDAPEEWYKMIAFFESEFDRRMASQKGEAAEVAQAV